MKAKKSKTVRTAENSSTNAVKLEDSSDMLDCKHGYITDFHFTVIAGKYHKVCANCFVLSRQMNGEAFLIKGKLLLSGFYRLPWEKPPKKPTITLENISSFPAAYRRYLNNGGRYK